jgi:hypothetical protein
MVTRMVQGVVPGVFSHRTQAEAAIAELRTLGFTDEQLGVAVPDALYHGLGAAQRVEDQDIMGEEEVKGTISGFILGAPLGSLAGVALAALTFGGLGPLGVGGILLGAGTGALWGMMLGAEAGLLAKVHSEEEEPHWSEIPLSHTDILIMVQARDRVAAVHEVIVRHGGRCFCALDRLQRPAE